MQIGEARRRPVSFPGKIKPAPAAISPCQTNRNRILTHYRRWKWGSSASPSSRPLSLLRPLSACRPNGLTRCCGSPSGRNRHASVTFSHQGRAAAGDGWLKPGPGGTRFDEESPHHPARRIFSAFRDVDDRGPRCARRLRAQVCRAQAPRRPLILRSARWHLRVPSHKAHRAVRRLTACAFAAAPRRQCKHRHHPTHINY